MNKENKQIPISELGIKPTVKTVEIKPVKKQDKTPWDMLVQELANKVQNK